MIFFILIIISGYVRKIVLWTTFLSLMILVCISRCFIATHFPHQVIAGVIVGEYASLSIELHPLNSNIF